MLKFTGYPHFFVDKFSLIFHQNLIRRLSA